MAITYQEHFSESEYPDGKPYRVVKDPAANLWDFSPDRHSDMRVVKNQAGEEIKFPKGSTVTLRGVALHPTGSRYGMTPYSYGQANITGSPRATNGINMADLVEVASSDPEPIPDPDPVPDPEPDPEPQPDPEPDPEPDPQPEPSDLSDRVSHLEALVSRRTLFDPMAPLYVPDGTRPMNRDRNRLIVGPMQRKGDLYNYSSSSGTAGSLIQTEDRASDWFAQQDGHAPVYTTSPNGSIPGAADVLRVHWLPMVGVSFRIGGGVRLRTEPKGDTEGPKFTFLDESNDRMWHFGPLRKNRIAVLFQEDDIGTSLDGLNNPFGKVWAKKTIKFEIGKWYGWMVDVRDDGLIRCYLDTLAEPLLTHTADKIAPAGRIGLRGDGAFFDFTICVWRP